MGRGVALVSVEPLSFFGGVDPRTGRIVEKGHELYGRKIASRVLIFPRGKGSTVGSYVIYSMSKYGTAPAAILNVQTEPIVVAGCVLGNIPLVDRLETDPTESIRNGDHVSVDGGKGIVKVRRKRTVASKM